MGLCDIGISDSCYLQVSILHPLATLDWEDCTPLPEPVVDPQCVLLHDVLYVGGGLIPSGDNSKLFMSNTVNKRLVWDVCRTPTEFYALTTYHSQLVLVGGRDREPSNMLWTLSSDAGMNWQPSIQKMPTKRWGAAAMNTGTPEYLVVAGGKGVGGCALDTVEVFTGKEWCTVDSLPQNCHYHKCIIHGGKYYLCGGYPYNIAYCCDIKSILKSCEKFGINKAPVWSQFEFPLEYSSLVSFGQHLISIGGITNYNYSSPDIVALSPLTHQSWVYVGKLPIGLLTAASIVLPTGELVVIGGDHGGESSASVFKATLTGEVQLFIM